MTTVSFSGKTLPKFSIDSSASGYHVVMDVKDQIKGFENKRLTHYYPFPEEKLVLDYLMLIVAKLLKGAELNLKHWNYWM